MDLQERRRGRFRYYYLVYSFRDGSHVRKIERYVGRTLPKSLSSLKEALAQEVVTTRWGRQLDTIRTRYAAELRKMPPSIQTKELHTFATRFTYDSNRIEGSSLTLRETAALLEHGITPSHRPLSDVQETLAHERVFSAVLSPRESLTRATFLGWHRDLFRETKRELAGRVRQHQVRIAGSRFVPPAPFEVDLLLDEFFAWLRRAWRTVHPVLLAALVHLRLVTIHPFGDGNGRASRLAMNLVLYRKGFPMLDIPYAQRAGYYRALERAQTKQDEFVFVQWFVRRYVHANPEPRRPARQRRPPEPTVVR